MNTPRLKKPRTRRASAQREAVLAVLNAARRPLAVETVLARARRHSPAIGIATVYRALHALAASARVQLIALPSGSVFYELAGTAAHDHLYCTRCKHLHCLKPCRVTLHSSAARRVQVTGRALLLYGTCAACTPAGCRCRDT